MRNLSQRAWTALALAYRAQGASPKEAHGNVWRLLLRRRLVTFPDQGPIKDRVVATLRGVRAWEAAQRRAGLDPRDSALKAPTTLSRRELDQEVRA